MRGVHHHLQRIAIQGSPDALTALTGTFLPGATRREGGEHPFRKHFEDLEVGDTLVTGSRRVTVEDIERFADLTGDRFYAHMDEEAAKASPIFQGRVAHGYFVIAAAAGLFVWPDPGPVLANYGLERLRFTTPVYPGDELHVVFTCKKKSPREGAGRRGALGHPGGEPGGQGGSRVRRAHHGGHPAGQLLDQGPFWRPKPFAAPIGRRF